MNLLINSIIRLNWFIIVSIKKVLDFVFFCLIFLVEEGIREYIILS